MQSVRARSVPTLALLLVTAPALAATKVVDVGPDDALVFVDEESRTDTTTISVGDTVEWRWMSSRHSTTRTDTQEGWDSSIQDAPFTFSHTFATPGTFPYHCTSHQFFGMTGTVVVGPSGPTTTTTVPPPACTDLEAVARVRAALDTECDCPGAPRLRSYSRCTAAVAKRAVRAGSLPRACLGRIKRCAAQSTCGRPGFITCCRTTARGVQTCSIKRAAAACRAPRRGIACVGDRPSCCDACGDATCPAPASTTTTLARTHRSTTTTSTMPSVSTLCDGGVFCAGGTCLTKTSLLCPDGTSALWLGTAVSDIGAVDIAFAICPSHEFFSGTFFCLPGSVSCFVTQSATFGTIAITVDGVSIVLNPFTFGEGAGCTFNGSLLGLTMSGDFTCFDAFGFAVSSGTWSATRCP